jgi:hypothetical protein
LWSVKSGEERLDYAASCSSFDADWPPIITKPKRIPALKVFFQLYNHWDAMRP